MTSVPEASLDRSVGRTVFGQDAAGYDRVRADYPVELFDRLSRRCGGLDGRAVFEIGPGTGLATRGLLAANIGSLTAFEPDAAMVGHLERTLDDDRLRIVARSFEPGAVIEPVYDVGVAAASFHWLDQRTALASIRSALKPGGQWAMWWNVYRTNSPQHPLSEAIRPLIASLPQPPSERAEGHRSLDVRVWTADLCTAGFIEVEHRLVRRDRSLTGAEARALYASFSFVRSLTPDARERLLDAIETIVIRDFAGLVPSPILTAAYFATTSGKRVS